MKDAQSLIPPLIPLSRNDFDERPSAIYQESGRTEGEKTGET